MTGLRVAGPRVGELQVGGLGAGRHGPLLGVDDPAPDLSWRLLGDSGHQSACRVQVFDERGEQLWDSGVVESGCAGLGYGGPRLPARTRVEWRVRVRDQDDRWSPWSERAGWETGLLTRAEWGGARWIAHPRRGPGDPLPIFARAFRVSGPVRRARLYVCGLGVQVVTLNGRPVTDEVLAPGNSNYQRSAEYRTYDVTESVRCGPNTLGVRLGHGTAHVHREGTNSGLRDAYSWWTSHDTASGVLSADASAGDDSVRATGTGGYFVGGSVHVGEGEQLEDRWITALGDESITFAPPLERAHPAGTPVAGSGDPVADVDPSAGAAVPPRMLARLELTTAGREEAIVSGPEWRTALGPAVTDNWFSGTDHDARREQPGWDEPGADHSAEAVRRDGSRTDWIDAMPAAPPNLATELVRRAGPPVRVVREWEPVAVREPEPGIQVFDLGQNIAGWPELRLPPVPAGTAISLRPGEALTEDGRVDQTSIRDATRGTDVLHTYIAAGSPEGERWRPAFQYFAMRFVEVAAPEGIRPGLRGLQLRADAAPAGAVRTSDGRINRLHRMAHFSVAANLMSVLTDCPGREKLAYGADYTHPIGVLSRHFDLSAYLRTMQRHLVEGQAGRGPRAGNVALKAPVYDWGYTGDFGDEVNWGNAIVLVPWLLHRLYGDTRTMAQHYSAMTAYLDYLSRRKANGHLVTGPLGDWVGAEDTSGELTGTWGYYLTTRRLADMAGTLGRTTDFREFCALAEAIAGAFHDRFFDAELGCYTGDGATSGATQAAQALPLDAGMVPEAERPRVLDALLGRIHHRDGPRLLAGHIGLGPVVRVLRDADRDDVLWAALRRDEVPGYGAFLRDHPQNPGGLTTIPEQWDMVNSLNHMILTQIDEWFHTGIAGIRQEPGSVGFRRLLIRPKPVGDLLWAEGHYRAPAGRIETRWRRDGADFTLTVRIPPNTSARVQLPGRVSCRGSPGVAGENAAGAVFSAGPGTHTFTSDLEPE